MTTKFENPILSGFYPDPSICRVGEDYYMVTSSFCYFPGLPVFHSRDLVHWNQIGHAIHRESQLDYMDCDHSGGLWAPTIRYYNGYFYIINTFSLKDSEAYPDSVCKNFVIRTDDIWAGHWSDPIFITGADGIDPSLFWDDDERLWYTGNCCPSPMEWAGHRAIYLMELDLETFQPLGKRRIIWDGAYTHCDYIEAPHLYKIDGWYYLMVAAGGTQENHSVMISRSKCVEGPYEVCPRNPVVTARHSWNNPTFASVGHGDLVQTQNGEWWMVLLAVRPYSDYQYNMGRETCLLPIAWDEQGWPYADNEAGTLRQYERMPDLPLCYSKPEIAADNFENPSLGMQWNTMRPWTEGQPDLISRPGCLRLHAEKEKISDSKHCAFVGRRQQHFSFEAVTKMEAYLEKEGDFAGLAIIQNHKNYILFGLEKQKTQTALKLIVCEQGHCAVCHERNVIHTEKIYLGIQAYTEEYGFFYGETEADYIPIKETVPTDLLSTTKTGGFTGVYIGFYASGNGKETESYADYDWFVYEGK